MFGPSDLLGKVIRGISIGNSLFDEVRDPRNFPTAMCAIFYAHENSR
jgi:hypothetical protein